jgi:hypothetical protein
MTRAQRVKDLAGNPVEASMGSHLLRFAADLARLEKQYGVVVERAAALHAETEGSDVVVVSLSEVAP